MVDGNPLALRSRDDWGSEFVEMRVDQATGLDVRIGHRGLKSELRLAFHREDRTATDLVEVLDDFVRMIASSAGNAFLSAAQLPRVVAVATELKMAILRQPNLLAAAKEEEAPTGCVGDTLA